MLKKNWNEYTENEKEVYFFMHIFIMEKQMIF